MKSMRGLSFVTYFNRGGGMPSRPLDPLLYREHLMRQKCFNFESISLDLCQIFRVFTLCTNITNPIFKYMYYCKIKFLYSMFYFLLMVIG